jgi:hypothetical protein
MIPASFLTIMQSAIVFTRMLRSIALTPEAVATFDCKMEASSSRLAEERIKATVLIQNLHNLANRCTSATIAASQRSK